MTELGRWPHNLLQLALVFWTMVALGGLYDAVHQGLLMQPNMQVAGAGSTQDTLRWYTDRISGVLPSVSVFSAPMWTWRVLMLCWALWLASRCIRWLPWALRCMREGGGWRYKPAKAIATPPMAAAVVPAPTSPPRETP